MWVMIRRTVAIPNRNELTWVQRIKKLASDEMTEIQAF